MTYDLHLPTGVDEAIALLLRYDADAAVMAGGTSLVLQLAADGRIRPAHVVALKRIAELRGIERSPDGTLVMRALTTHREAEMSPLVAAHCPALAQAFGSVATVRIREQATVGGNLVHGDPAHDPPPMLIALDAHVIIAGARGERRVPVEELHTAGRPVRAGEIVTRVVVPPVALGTRAAFIKYLPDTRYGYGTVSVGVAVTCDTRDTCIAARIAVAGCAPTALRLHDAERALLGRPFDAAAIADSAARAAAGTRPLDDIRGTAAYKRAMARVWVARALTRLAA